MRARDGLRYARPGVVIQMRPRPDDAEGPVRAGFTATKKIGNAVVRNRAKRRLREAARMLLPLHGRVGSDYVFIARGATGTRAWTALLDDVETALISLARKSGETDTRAPARRPKT
ncbi:ribonuclease P protein component [Maricaulaceae bacterium EIL42A08]|nr:ribonuclease P protein component [Maricaulaceae bacterium EIL42A08]MCP2678280.1 ribonuclease P protein component [Maricaulaceae bacterium NA33B04]